MNQALLIAQCPTKELANAGDAKRDCGRTLKLAGKVKVIQGHPAGAEGAKAEGLKTGVEENRLGARRLEEVGRKLRPGMLRDAGCVGRNERRRRYACDGGQHRRRNRSEHVGVAVSRLHAALVQMAGSAAMAKHSYVAHAARRIFGVHWMPHAACTAACASRHLGSLRQRNERQRGKREQDQNGFNTAHRSETQGTTCCQPQAMALEMIHFSATRLKSSSICCSEGGFRTLREAKSSACGYVVARMRSAAFARS